MKLFFYLIDRLLLFCLLIQLPVELRSIMKWEVMGFAVAPTEEICVWAHLFKLYLALHDAWYQTLNMFFYYDNQ